jgi:hypothetical protein
MKWTELEAKHLRATARQCFNHYKHGNTKDERENCSACCLRGYEPRGGFGDGYKVARDGPNYAGWARVYVEAGFAIPKKWRAAFAREQNSDNKAYANALTKSIETFGVTFL